MRLPLLTLGLVIPLLARAPPGRRSQAAEEARRKLYVANTSGNTVTVIDLDLRKAVREIPVGEHPHGLTVSPDSRRLYCTIESERVLELIDTSTDRIVDTIALTG